MASESIFTRKVLLHVAGWITFFITPILLSPPHEMMSAFTETNNLVSLIIRNLLMVALFYVNLLYLCPAVLHKKGAGAYSMIIIPLVIVVSLVNWKIHHTLSEPFMPGYGGGPPPPRDFGFMPGPGSHPPMMLASSLFASFLITLIVATVSTSIILWEDVVKAKASEQERAFQKVASELAVLKLQISPHFLFNTLNNIRWLVRSKSDQAEEAVVKLSQLLRYILYQTNHDRIPLNKEVDNLRDYVSLQKMRLAEGQDLKMTFSGSFDNKMIVPLLFTPLVENFFKYGNFTNGENAISLSMDRDRMLFRTENAMLTTQKELREDSGIGLQNIKKRLQLHYPDKHLFRFYERDRIFFVEMEIIVD